MVKIVYGNLFDTDAQIIAHSCNCRGAMGSGVAKQVKERFPNVYKAYVSCCNISRARNANLLGEVLFSDASGECPFEIGIECSIEEFPIIANVFGQDNFGYDGKQYTDLEALRNGFKAIYSVALFHHWKVAIPYKIASDRGGADWDVVYKMIEEIFVGVEVELWKLN